MHGSVIPEALERFFIRRMEFDALLRRIRYQPIPLPEPFERYPCDACGYPTVEGWNFDYCTICHWEQDPIQNLYKGNPDEPNGGPNGPYSLTDARLNFERYGCMFSQDDHEVFERAQREAADRQRLLAAYEALRTARRTEDIVAAVGGILAVERAWRQATRAEKTRGPGHRGR
ncbi:MAG: hypothetical protein KatS3mg042_1400 [Rhodothermaceae bacterium]|nr:MAG: hypothetical protein KatS3mg042_1400 [Rhodothermaceae bacterium]